MGLEAAQRPAFSRSPAEEDAIDRQGSEHKTDCKIALAGLSACNAVLYRPSSEGRTLRPRESAARNERDTARNVRRSAAHKGLQPVRHPNARLHYLWRERGAVDRVEHVADERP